MLLGAADTLLTEMGADFKPFERRLHEETVARVIALCGDELFRVARARGAGMELEHVLDEALAETSA